MKTIPYGEYLKWGVPYGEYIWYGLHILLITPHFKEYLKDQEAYILELSMVKRSIISSHFITTSLSEV